MQTGRRLLILLTADLCLLASAAPADTHYVSWSGAHVPPFTNWADAATNIQAAVDVAAAGDEVVVGDGAYTERGPAHPSDPGAFNLVLVTNALTVRSENGASNTYLMCMTTDEVIRCVWLASNAVLDGFTLRHGRGALNGGGVYGPGAIVRNCRIAQCSAGTGGGAYGVRLESCELNSNTSTFDGGGAAYGSLAACVVDNNTAGRYGGGFAYGSLDGPTLVMNNSASERGGGLFQCVATNGGGPRVTGNDAAYFGGGAAGCVLVGAVLTSNVAPTQGGGAYDCQLRECTVSWNYSTKGGGASGGSLTNCRVSFNQAYQYGGGICGLDDGTAWQGAVVDGCTSEFNTVNGDGGGVAQFCDVRNSWLRGNTANGNGGGAAGGCTLSNCTLEMNFAARGGAADSCMLQDCQLINNNAQEYGIAYGNFDHVIDNCTMRGNRTTDPNSVAILFCEVRNSRMVENEGPSLARDNRITDTYIGSNVCGWLCLGGQSALLRVVVSNCVIEANSYFMAAAESCQIYNSTLARSTGGDTGGARFSSLYDCFIVSNSAIVGGVYSCVVWRSHIVGNFGGSVGGASRSWISDSVIAGNTSVVCAAVDGAGGGAVFNSAIVGNYLVTNWSGGLQTPSVVRQAQLVYCTIASNRAEVGTAADDSSAYLIDQAQLDGCRLSENLVAGGALIRNGSMAQCTISNNVGQTAGGLLRDIYPVERCLVVGNTCVSGAVFRMSSVHDSLIVGNTGGVAGAAREGFFQNCTIVGNTALGGPGGVSGAFCRDSIIYHNVGTVASNWWDAPGDFVSNSFLNCCTAPNPGGSGTVVAEPGFRDPAMGDYRLAYFSPCIDAGSGVEDGWDVAGNVRTLDGQVDLGAYENQGVLELRAVLSGAHTATGAMRTALQTGGSLPSTSPYAEDPRGVGSPPANAVDWVLVQLEETNANAVVASRSLFLRNDGRVMDENGATQFRVVGSPGPVRVVLKHRNHLAVMTDQMVAPTGDVVSVDLAADPGILRGGATAVVEVASGIWALRGGNVDGDDEVRPADELIRASQE